MHKLWEESIMIFSHVLAFFQEAMKKAEAAGNDDCPVKIKLVAPPLYVLTTQTLDKVQSSILSYDWHDWPYNINPPLLIVKRFMIYIKIVYLLEQLARIWYQ